MPSNRREFLTRAARALGSGALCTSTAAPKDLLATVAWPEELFGKALFAIVRGQSDHFDWLVAKQIARCIDAIDADVEERAAAQIFPRADVTLFYVEAEQ